MVKTKQCLECNGVMRCTAWHFESDAGAELGTGDFDCLNCDHIENNTRRGVYSIEGYSTVFNKVENTISFDDFLDLFEDKIIPNEGGASEE